MNAVDDTDDDTPPQGAEVDAVPDQDSDVEELPDGAALINLNVKPRKTGSRGFYDNLAESMTPTERFGIAGDLLDLLDKDKESRKKRDQQYEEGLRRSGLDRDARIGANFSGASKAMHPILAKSAVEFSALAIKEIFPPQGPVRAEIVGEQTKEKLAKAERCRDYLNYQMTNVIVEYRSEMEQLFTQASLGGSQFTKTYWCEEDGRIRHEFVPTDRIILPFSAANFLSARRKAQILDLTREEIESRIDSGLYRDMQISDPGMLPDATKSEETARKIEGKEETGYNEDGTRRLYETYVRMKLEGDTVAKPYIITLDDNTSDVWSIYRNWREDDKKFTELEWIVEWPFIPFRGALSVGLIHLIGGLSIAATGALNGLLDSAHVNNIPTAVALKGSKITGDSVEIEPTTVVNLEGPVGIDDVRKLVMPMPYNQPSPVLFELLGWLTQQAESVVVTASEKLADASNNGPVGTTYALIEQGAKVFSAIHSRFHFAQKRVLSIIRRLNAQYLSDQETVEDLGELVVSRADFEGPSDVIPVSDPNIFSETQRWAQLQAAMQLAQTAVQMGPYPTAPKYNFKALHRRALELLKFPQIDEILPEDPQAQQTNPIAENVNAVRGIPLMAFPQEDHIAHLQVHLSFVTDQSLGLINAPAMAPMMEHVKQHLLLIYATLSQMVASSAVGEDITAHMVDPKSLNEVDRLLAAAVPHVHEIYQKTVAPVMGMVQQLQQSLQQAQQAQAQGSAPPPDPQAQVAMQVGMAEVQRKSARDQVMNQLDQQEAQRKAQVDQAEQQRKGQKDASDSQTNSQELSQRFELELRALEQERKSDMAKIMAEIQKNREDNDTKKEIEHIKTSLKQMLDHVLPKGGLNGQEDQII